MISCTEKKPYEILKSIVQKPSFIGNKCWIMLKVVMNLKISKCFPRMLCVKREYVLDRTPEHHKTPYTHALIGYYMIASNLHTEIR